MLAVQRPSMGSSKLPDDMPFGCTSNAMPTKHSKNANSNADDFRQNSSFNLPSPPVPAPGPSLLDDNESKFLDSFFAGVNSDQFNFDFFTNAADGTDLAPGWDELPPTFMGTSSSCGQQPHPPPPPPPPGLSNMISRTPNTESPTTTETAPDVLAAAALLQNGPNGLRGMGNNRIFGNGHDPLLSANNMMGSQSIAQYNPLSATSLHSAPVHNLHQQAPVGNPYLFGSSQGGLPRSTPRSRPPLQWGSDVSFGTTSGLVLPTSQMEIEALDRAQMQTVETFIEALQNPSTADNTRPPSPQPFAPPPRSDQNNAYEESDDQPRKRRKSTFTDFDDDDDEEYQDYSTPQKANGSASRRRSTAKSHSSNAKDSSPSGSGHKRRKSSTQQAINAASRARENLTEDQKRENHIRSEQKRRTLIREGFEDLNELVPGLKQGGFSKSAVLGMTADWLEELVRGNERLKERCEELSTGRGRGR